VAKKVVSDALEDKYAQAGIQAGGTPVYFNAGITSAAECFPLLPQVVQGADSNNRVGDKIRPKSLAVDFTIVANGDLTSSQLNMFRLWILEDKSLRNLVNLPNTPIANLLLDNGAFTSGFTGIPNQIMTRTNRRRYKVFHEKIRILTAGTGQTPRAGNGYIGTQTFVSTQQSYKFRVKIPTPATLHYNGPLDIWPTNFAPFMCFGYVQPDGGAAPDNLIQRIAVNFITHLDYEDA